MIGEAREASAGFPALLHDVFACLTCQQTPPGSTKWASRPRKSAAEAQACQLVIFPDALESHSAKKVIESGKSGPEGTKG